MTYKYRVLLVLFLTILIFCGQVVFGQSKTIQKIVNIKNDKLKVELKSQHGNDCQAGPGAIDIATSGGVSPYNFAWTGSSGFKASTEDISNLKPGTYTLLVTDGSNCTYTNSWVIEATCASSCPLTSTASITNATACNIANGKIGVTITEGSGAYIYTWYDPNYKAIGNSNKLSSLAAGTYTLFVEDQKNKDCKRYFFYTISSPFKAAYTTQDNTSCALPFTGKITCTPSGGSGKYSYAWTLPNGSKKNSVANLSGIAGGLYSITITDVTFGCTLQQSFTVSTTAVLSISSTVTPATLCKPANGKISLTVSNGSGHYLYSWFSHITNANAGSTKDLDLASAGKYEFYVTDTSSNCAAFKSFTVPDKVTSRPSITPFVTSNTNCSAPFNGAVAVTTHGAAGPFAFAWASTDGLVSKEKDLSNAKADVYKLQTTDLSSGCIDSTSVTINDESFPNLSITLNDIVDATNCALNDGAVRATIISSGAYSTTWIGPDNFTSSQQNITQLVPGLYHLSVSVMCNRPPAIAPPLLQLEGKSTITLNLLDFISDADNNLDPSSLAITKSARSGARTSLDNNGNLILDYTGILLKGMDEVDVKVCDLQKACTEKSINIETEDHVIVYNAVAPNSSGDNKFMRIQNLPIKNKVSIFNRWGDKVFEVHDYDNVARKFEGISLKGRELPSGTYFYSIEVAENVEPITGYLALQVD